METELKLAYELLDMKREGWTEEEARQELKYLLENVFHREVMKEVDEELCYTFNDVVSDIIASVESLLDRMINNVSVC